MCHTNHHHNYAVRNGVRVYYSGIPEIIEVAKHSFVERRVLELFRSLALFAWVSATNAANVYHHSLSRLSPSQKAIPRWHMRTEHVWDGFVLLSLLKDAHTRKTVLQVPHTGDQKDRFTAAMSMRNDLIRTVGQPELRHFCTKCVRRFTRPDGVSSTSLCSAMQCILTYTCGQHTWTSS